MNIRKEYEKSLLELKLLQEKVKSQELEIREYESKIAKASIFNVKIIGKILEQLLTKITGENYTLKECEGYEHSIEFYQLESVVKKEKVLRYFIIKDGCEIDASKPIESNAMSSGEFLLLHEVSPASSISNIMNADFKRMSSENLPIEINFVNDFMSRLIEYRVTNNMTKIFFDEMKAFLDSYLTENIEELKEHYKRNKPRVVYVKIKE